MCMSAPGPSKQQKRILAQQEALIKEQRKVLAEQTAANKDLLDQERTVAAEQAAELAAKAAKARSGKSNFFSGKGIAPMSGGGEATSLLRRVSK